MEYVVPLETRAEVDFDFLLRALHFWDPADHVFWFGIDEICPTYVEFSWFLGQREDLPQGVITPSVGPRRVLAELLSVDVHRIRYMFVPGGLDLRRLLHFTRGAVAGSRARTVGAMVCCFATLLFVLATWSWIPPSFWRFARRFGAVRLLRWC